MHYLLIYQLAPDFLPRRKELRIEHLTHAWQSHERGELVLGGALAEPVDEAVLLFRCDSPATVEKFAAADPYVVHGLATSWKVRPWVTVAGDEADTPIRP